MLVAALFRHDRVPQNVRDLALDRFAVEIGQVHAVGRQNRHIAIGKEEHVPRVAENRGHVGGDEVLAIAQADHGRRARAGRHDLVRLRLPMIASANTPFNCFTAQRTAASRFPCKYFSIRWAMTSVSVSVMNLWPSSCNWLLERKGNSRQCRCGRQRYCPCSRGAGERSLPSGVRAWPIAYVRFRRCLRAEWRGSPLPDCAACLRRGESRVHRLRPEQRFPRNRSRGIPASEVRQE